MGEKRHVKWKFTFTLFFSSKHKWGRVTYWFSFTLFWCNIYSTCSIPINYPNKPVKHIDQLCTPGQSWREKYQQDIRLKRLVIIHYWGHVPSVLGNTVPLRVKFSAKDMRNYQSDDTLFLYQTKESSLPRISDTSPKIDILRPKNPWKINWYSYRRTSISKVFHDMLCALTI